MKYLLDTDVCIRLLKGDDRLDMRLWEAGFDNVALCWATHAELAYGAYKSRRREKSLKAELQSAGRPLDDFDLVIAATALVHDLTLVTGNQRHFRRIEGLRVENWLE